MKKGNNNPNTKDPKYISGQKNQETDISQLKLIKGPEKKLATLSDFEGKIWSSIPENLYVEIDSPEDKKDEYLQNKVY